MTIEKKNGGYLIYTLKDGYLFKMFYIGYTLNEAKSLFRTEIRKKVQS